MRKRDIAIYVTVAAASYFTCLVVEQSIKLSDRVAALEKQNLNLNNRLAVQEGHRPTLDENDTMIFDAIEALNYNDQIIAEQINRLACEANPDECAFIYD